MEKEKKKKYKEFLEAQREEWKKKRDALKAREEEKNIDEFTVIETALTAQITATRTLSERPDLKPQAETSPKAQAATTVVNTIDKKNIPPGPGSYTIPREVWDCIFTFSLVLHQKVLSGIIRL